MLTKSKSRIKEFYAQHVKNMSRREKTRLHKNLRLELGLKTNQAFYNQKNGKVDMTISQGLIWSKLFGCSMNDLFSE